MTFATMNAAGTMYTISLSPTITGGKVDIGQTIERFRRIVGNDAVFTIVGEAKNG